LGCDGDLRDDRMIPELLIDRALQCPSPRGSSRYLINNEDMAQARQGIVNIFFTLLLPFP
jgi:hypothetical protein